MTFECHAHLFMNGESYPEAAALHRDGVDVRSVGRFFEAYRAAGIAYIRDGGDKFGVSALAKSMAGDYGLDYATPVFAIHKQGRYGGIVGKSYDTFDDFRRLVDEAAAQGADFIKVMYSGILSFDVFGQLSCPSLNGDEMQKLVEIAHERGFRVMAHVNGAEAVRDAILAGTDSLEHGYYMDEACLRLLAKRETVWVPTAAAVAAFAGRPGFDAAVVGQILELQLQNVRRALELGAHVAIGSDGGAVGVSHGSGVLREKQLLETAAGTDFGPALEEGCRLIQSRFRRF